MNYKETIEYLYDNTPMFQHIGSKAYKEGLENTYTIDSLFGHPHWNYHTIHVGGTNGKGSTSHLIASILMESGYRTGLYTSPHLLDFRERIKINGTLVTKKFVIDFVARHKNFFKKIDASFFELTTAMAFAWFEKEKVDIAIIEVGLGGRLDCTNIIQPDLSVITNISLDHTAQLGNTLTAIAREKAGIIKFGVPLVVGEASGEVKQVFLETAASKQTQIVFAEKEEPIIRSERRREKRHTEMRGARRMARKQNEEEEREGWYFKTKDYGDIFDELGGFAQEKNAATVLCAIGELRKIGYQIPLESVRKGFSQVIENTGLYGRWQIIQTQPKIVLDTGHNTGGMEYIVRQLRSEIYDRLHIVIGMVNDKDVSSVLRLLPPDAIYYFTQASVPRALDSGILAEKAAEAGLKGNLFLTVKEALCAAKEVANENDFIFVGGSTFVVADALASSKVTSM